MRKSLGRGIKLLTIIMAEAAMLLLSSCGNTERDSAISYISEKYSVPEEKQLIIYTSHKEEVYLPIIREFENRTGIWVDIHAGGTAEMLDQVKIASENAACDIMFGGGIESYEAQKDLFIPYRAKDREKIDEASASIGNYYTPFTELPIVFVYNNKLVSKRDAPKTWEGLFDEKWKGKIAFADLWNSGTSYTIISTMEQLFNEPADQLLPRFYDQLDAKTLSSSGQVIPKVSDGSFLVGITLEETAKKAILSGYDISMVYPADGTSAVPDGCAMVKNAPHSYNAGKFIDFVVSLDTQNYAMEEFYRRPVRQDIDLLKDFGKIEMIEFDIEKSALEEPEVLRIWDELTGREGG
jgi:iron(III) transport system substrate-binding protein